MAIQNGVQTIGKRAIRYCRDTSLNGNWTRVYLLAHHQETFLGRIKRTENPRRYNGHKLKADAALGLLAKHARESNT